MSMFISELLPAPEGPRMAESWPDLKNPLMPCRMVFPPGNNAINMHFERNYRFNMHQGNYMSIISFKTKAAFARKMQAT
jgi:hypothetical protein